MVAFALLTTIIVLSTHCDGHYMSSWYLPEWLVEINLRTVVSILTSFLGSAIVDVVAEIIGQIKWTWFMERTRPLQHLQTFDQASRSTLGSVRLVVIILSNAGFTSAGLLDLFAGLMTIASLDVGPMTQQAIKKLTCQQLESNTRSSIPVVHYVLGSLGYYRIGAGLYELEVDMKSTMLQGITDPTSKDNILMVGCSTGNYSWPDYGTGVTHTSIGLCSACLNTTNCVTGLTYSGNLTLPDTNAFINFGSGGQYMWVGYSNLSAYESEFSKAFAR